MNNKTLGALVAFLALGGVAIWLLKKPPKGERTGERPRPIAKLDKKSIAKITLARDGKKTVVLALDGKVWKLDKPVKYAADKHSVDQLVKKLGELAFGDLVTEQAQKHPTHGVDSKAGVRVTVADKGGKTLADFWVGKVTSGFTMVRPHGKNAVWQAVGAMRHAVRRDVKDWRDKTIFKVKRQSIVAFDVTTAEGTTSIERKDSKSPWKLIKSPLAFKALEKGIITSLLSTFYGLSAFAFADGAKTADSGLDKPAATIVARTEDKKTLKLLIGKKHKKSDYYVKRGSSPQVYLLKQYTVASLMKRPIDFRTLDMLAYKKVDVVSFTVSKLKVKKSDTIKFTRKGKTWVGNGKKLKSDKKVKDAVDMLSRLKADRWSRASAKDLGLETPGWTLVIELKGNKKHTLRVGADAKAGYYGVLLSGEKLPYELRKYRVDKWLLDPSDFK